MYRVYTADGVPLHDPDLFESGYQCLDPTVVVELNKHGSFQAKLPPTHPRHGTLPRRQTYLGVSDGEKTIWRGRLIQSKRDTNNNETLYCEGAMAYLLDSVYRPFSLPEQMTPEAFLTLLLNNHNLQMPDSYRKIRLGTVTVTGTIYRASETAKTTWTLIKEKLLNSLGGYLRIRYEPDGNFLDYLSDFEEECSQAIEYGKNLLSITQEYDASDIISHLIPYGAKDDDTQERVDITSVNDGRDYITSDLIVGSYGRIWGTVVFDDITTPAALLTRAGRFLYNQQERAVITATAVDLSVLDASVEPFRLGAYTPMHSSPHDLNVRLICRKQTIPLMNLGAARSEFGTGAKTLTDLVGGNR